VLFLQYYAQLILNADRPGPNAQAVARCARALDIRVVDQFASLRQIVLDGPPNVIHDYYNYDDGVFGHMTAKGNAQAAGLIHPAVRDWLATILGWTSQTQAPTPPPEGAGALQP
jgi:hypothetical protein